MNTRKSPFRRGLIIGILLAAWAVLPSCRLYHLERELPAADAEFLTTVQYIITGEERRIFLELAETDREKFKEDFWKRRDSDPYTEENEFKTEYLGRVEQAKELFRGEGKPGNLTDRGRIYILLGPPLDRLKNPLGVGVRSQCSEVWYYGSFPVVFADSTCSGDFRLVTYDLSPVREINLAYMQELTMAQDKAQRAAGPQGEKGLFKFTAELVKSNVTEARVDGLVRIRIPLSTIWFKADPQKLQTTLEVSLELKDADKKVYWEKKDTIVLSLTEEELKQRMEEIVQRDYPFVFDQDLARLRKGKNTLAVTVKNTTGDEVLRKTLDLTL